MRVPRTETISAALLVALTMAACRDREPPPVPGATAPSPARGTAAPGATTTATDATTAVAASAPRSAGDAGAGDGGEVEPKGPSGKLLCFGDSITQADWPGK